MKATNLRRSGLSAALLVSIMVLGGVVLWVGVPAGWIYIGGQMQAAGASIGAALLVMASGIVATIALILPLLGWLSRKHAQSRMARGHEDPGAVALEAVMVVSAGIALVAFLVWFFVISGAHPIPLSG